jgi:hypothetical protein
MSKGMKYVEERRVKNQESEKKIRTSQAYREVKFQKYFVLLSEKKEKSQV